MRGGGTSLVTMRRCLLTPATTPLPSLARTLPLPPWSTTSHPFTSTRTRRADEADEAHSNAIDENFRSFRKRGDQGRIISVSRKLGREVLNDGAINKGTAFPESERERMHIRGLLPPAVSSLELQAHRIWSVLKDEPDPVKRWTVLASLQDRNETLYYHVLQRHVTELAPVIYTPTVAFACKNYSTIFRKPRGMFFSAQDRGHMASMVHNWPGNDVEVVVVTDGSRVLGLGDLGVHGIAVVIGKVDLYVVGAGFYPTRTLPVVVDVGTNNDELLGSDMYLGLNRRRLSGRPYLHIMDEFMHAVRLRWPQAVIQFEDFETKHAEMLLERYRNTHCCFNDDIQGTASVAVAAVYGALAVRGQRPEAIVRETFIIQGAGSAGLGVANALVRAMRKHGLATAAAYERIWLLDAEGLVTSERPSVAASVRKFQRQVGAGSHLVDASLATVVHESSPSALLGLTGGGRLWDDAILTAMGRSCERPMIYPMSNPTDLAECTAEAAAACTGNRAIFASGSPFDDVRGEDGEITMRCNQSNNFYIFPGVGLGAQAGKLKAISDEQFLVAAEVLAGLTSAEDLAAGVIFPPLSNIRHISKTVAKAVIMQGLREGQISAEMTELHAVRHLVDSEDPLDNIQLHQVLDRLVADPDQCYRPVAYPSLVYRHVGVDE